MKVYLTFMCIEIHPVSKNVRAVVQVVISRSADQCGADQVTVENRKVSEIRKLTRDID